MEIIRQIAELILIISVSGFGLGCAGVLFLHILDEIKWKNKQN